MVPGLSLDGGGYKEANTRWQQEKMRRTSRWFPGFCGFQIMTPGFCGLLEERDEGGDDDEGR